MFTSRRAVFLTAIAIGLGADAAAAQAPLVFTPVGDADPVCHGGIWPGFARQLRNSLGCLLARSATLAADPGPAGQELETLKKRLLVRNFRGLVDEQAREWIDDPSTGLVPRAGFIPQRFEQIEFAKISPGETYRYINPTGKLGLTFGEYTGDFVFRAELVAQVNERQIRIPTTGVFRPTYMGAWIVSIKLASPALSPHR